MNPEMPSRGAFSAALARAFEMEPEDAQEVADVVLERFAVETEVDDETLDAELRSVFYTLESKKMLSFRRVEVAREDGDRRRAFFWRLRPDGLESPTHAEAPEVPEDVYGSLPANAWQHAG